MNLNTFHGLNMDLAKNFFLKRGSLSTTLIVCLPNNKLLVCDRDFENTEDKIFTYYLYSIILKMKNSPMYSIISEAWVSKETNLNGPFLAPSQKSDRKEVLFITTRNKKGDLLFNVFKIERSENNIELIKSDSSDDLPTDNLNLFERINHSKITEQILEELQDSFEKIEKPSWYHELDIMELH